MAVTDQTVGVAAPACRRPPTVDGEDETRDRPISLTRRTKDSRNGKSVEAVPMCRAAIGYAGIGLQPCLVPAQRINRWPRYSAGQHHMLHITARFPGNHR